MLGQLGNNACPAFEDSLLSMFQVDNGNILYTPNIQELMDLNLHQIQGSPSVLNLKNLSDYHEVNWLKSYAKKMKDE
jgi:hypothetical protein